MREMDGEERAAVPVWLWAGVWLVEQRRMSNGLGRRNSDCRCGGIYGGNELHTELCLLDKGEHSKVF